jgi:hypothetical protein
MYFVHVLVVDSTGDQQGDAHVEEFATLAEAFRAAGNAARECYLTSQDMKELATE